MLHVSTIFLKGTETTACIHYQYPVMLCNIILTDKQ